MTCKHELSAQVCVFCNGSKGLLQETETPYDEEVTAVITTDINAAQTKSQIYEKINAAVTKVHIVGHPFGWVLQQIFACGPRVNTIQFAPRFEPRALENQRKTVLKHGATIVYGLIRPQSVWKTKRPRYPSFELNRAFFLELGEKDKKTFQEMLEFGFMAALVTQRYLCLDGRPYQTLEEVAKSFGFISSLHCSIYVNGTRKFFERKFKCSKRAKEVAHALRVKLKRARSRNKTLQHAQEKRLRYLARIAKLVEKASVKFPIEVPANLPASHQGVYAFLVECLADGRATKLSRQKPKYWKVLSFRYGLEGSNVFHTLELTRIRIKRTRERVRQIEAEGLSKLGMPPKLWP